MDYGALIKNAWRMTWRYRFLWVLALFAGGGSSFFPGTGGNVGTRGWGGQVGGSDGPGPFGGGAGDFRQPLGEAARWALDNAGLLIGGGVLVLLLALAWLVLSLIAQGALAQATVDLAEGRQTTLGAAWRTGLRLFWRYVGMYLILFGLAMAVGLAVAVAVGLLVALGSIGGGATGFAVLIGVLVSVPLVLLGIVLGVATSIVVTFAQRALAADDSGPVEALRSGVRLLRAHPGESILVWLIGLALGIGASLVVGLAVVILAVPLVLLGFGVWSGAGMTATIFYGVVAVLLAVVVAVALGTIVNTYFWHYWSGAFVRLRHGWQVIPASVAVPAPA
jgi:hypothetical protein